MNVVEEFQAFIDSLDATDAENLYHLISAMRGPDFVTKTTLEWKKEYTGAIRHIFFGHRLPFVILNDRKLTSADIRAVSSIMTNVRTRRRKVRTKDAQKKANAMYHYLYHIMEALTILKSCGNIADTVEADRKEVTE